MKYILISLLLVGCSTTPESKPKPTKESFRDKMQKQKETCVIKLTNAGVSDVLIRETCIVKIRNIRKK